MIAASSLSAFSGASTTAPLNRPEPANPVRLVREAGGGGPRKAAGPAPALPETRPSVPPARGSLINLSV